MIVFDATVCNFWYLYENVTIVLDSQKNVFQKLAYFNLSYCLLELKVINLNINIRYFEREIPINSSEKKRSLIFCTQCVCVFLFLPTVVTDSRRDASTNALICKDGLVACIPDMKCYNMTFPLKEDSYFCGVSFPVMTIK